VAFTRKQRVTLAIVPRVTALLIRLLGLTWRYRDIQATNPDGTPVPIGIAARSPPMDLKAPGAWPSPGLFTLHNS